MVIVAFAFAVVGDEDIAVPLDIATVPIPFCERELGCDVQLPQVRDYAVHVSLEQDYHVLHSSLKGEQGLDCET